MAVRWVGLFVFAVFLLGKPVVSQDAPPAPELTFHFPTTPEVSIKLKAPNLGRPVRGKLLSLTAGEVIVDTGVLSRRDRERGERGQRVPFERIETLRSSDGRFEFSPDGDFRLIAQKVIDSYPSIRVEGSVNALNLDRPPRKRSKKDDDDDSEKMPLPGAVKPAMEDDGDVKSPSNMPSRQKPKGIGNGGFGGMRNLPKIKKGEEDLAGTPDEEMPSDASSDPNTASSLSEAGEVLFCSNCSKEIPASAVKSGVCPHCKATFLNTSVTPSAASKDPFGKTGGSSANSGAGAFAPSGTAPAGQVAPVAGQPASNTVVVQGGGFSFDQVPNWAKGGIFILLILAAYQILFNR